MTYRNLMRRAFGGAVRAVLAFIACLAGMVQEAAPDARLCHGRSADRRALPSHTKASPPHDPIEGMPVEPHRLAMVFKLVEAAQKYWRRLDGNDHCQKLILRVKFSNGLEVVAMPADLPSRNTAARPSRHQESAIAPVVLCRTRSLGNSSALALSTSQ
jgi:hypothetical protein